MKKNNGGDLGILAEGIMKDLGVQDLGSQVIVKRTADCKEVWNLFKQIRLANEDPDFVGTKARIDELLEQLETAFTDFECSWEQHAKEYHS